MTRLFVRDGRKPSSEAPDLKDRGPIATNAVKWGKQVAIDKAGPGAVAVATRGTQAGEVGWPCTNRRVNANPQRDRP